MISIQSDDFDQGVEYAALASGKDTGAVVSFVGRVRDFGDGSLYLDHYPGMTKKVLEKIIAQAHARWQLHKVRIIHRFGELAVEDQIVFVGISASHRKDAFAACEFIMDFLKTEAPFWKKERDLWVDAKDSDTDAALRWKKT